MNNNKIITPFVIHKNYGGGRIIFVNIAGYFDAIINSHGLLFPTLRNIPRIIDLDKVITIIYTYVYIRVFYKHAY